MAAGVEAANDALSRVGFIFEGMRNQLAVGLAPVLQSLAVNFQEASAAGGPLQNAVAMLVSSFSDLATTILDPAFIEAATLFGVTIANAISGLAGFMVTLANNAEIAGTAMIALGAAMAFFSGPIGLAIAAVAGGVFLLSTRLGQSATAADEAAQAEARLHAALDHVDRSNSDAVASGEALISTHIDQARAALEAAKAEYALQKAEAQRELNAAVAMAGAMPEGWNSASVDMAAEDLANANEYGLAEIEKAEAQLERYQKVLEGFQRSKFPSQGTGANSGGAGSVPPDSSPNDPMGVQKLNEDLATLISTIDPATARAEQLKSAMQLLTKAKQAGIITSDEYIARTKQIHDAFGELPGSTSAAAAGIGALHKELEKNPAAEMADEVSGAVGNLITRIDSGRDALKNFALELVKIFAVRGISKLLGGSDWLTGSLIGANALGTDNWRGGLSWVGEKGPELVNLPMGAQVIPNNMIGGMGGGGMSFSYAPKIDARGASLEAVQELDQRMRADAAQFNSKVEQAVLKAQSGRKL
jgi:hypothetical protein